MDNLGRDVNQYFSSQGNQGATCDPREGTWTPGIFIFPNLRFFIFWQPFKTEPLLHTKFPMIVALEICEFTEHIKESRLLELLTLG